MCVNVYHLKLLAYFFCTSLGRPYDDINLEKNINKGLRFRMTVFAKTALRVIVIYYPLIMGGYYPHRGGSF